MPEKCHTVDEVYGLKRGLPLNYVERHAVDDLLKKCLGGDKHIIIFGSSKQGKTCVRKHCIEEDDHIRVQCSNKWTLANLHTNILKAAGYEVTLAKSEGASGTRKIVASISASLLTVAKAKLKGEKTDTTSKEVTSKPLELDPSDVNDIIRALKSLSFNKHIILEDFHYLAEETQRDFAIALKAYHESSDLNFIIVGVWLDENRLIVDNGDLAGRVVSVNADRWESTDLKKVIEEGQALLNVSFPSPIKDAIIEKSFGSVYIVQEVCKAACILNGVEQTLDEVKEIKINDVAAEVNTVVHQENARYNSFVQNFAAGFQETDLQMYKWLLLPILTESIADIEAGLPQAVVGKIVKARHPKGNDLNPGNITQALKSISSLQIRKRIQPLVVDYDQSSQKLTVVDRGFLVWREYQDVDSILAEHGIGDDG